jgi:hypothetical protein
MNGWKARYRYLFQSTRGLILVAIGLIALVTAIWGTLSGPMAEMGVKAVTVRLLGMNLVEAEREGRIITLYHSIALAVVAILTYMITALVAMKESHRLAINATVTVGYLCTMFFGLAFGYFGHVWIFHGLFIFGQSLVFFAGVMLAVALWPFSPQYALQDRAYARGPRGLDLERLAFFIMAVTTLGSAAFGAVAGSYFGNGFQAFLAENTIREPHKTLLQKAIIGHLHIMLTLIGVALTLVIGRWLDFKGALHKIAMPLMGVGTIIISLGAWSVMVVEWAHTIIYVGSVFVMLAALFLVIFGWRKLIQIGLRQKGLEKGNFFQSLAALVRDPLPFGALWQMVFMNFTVSGVGIFMAAKLDEIFRVWPWREERILLTGHWHILSGIMATILLLYYADLIGLKGRVRQWFGWSVIIFSDLAFASATVFAMKRLFVSEAAQQPVVDTLMILIDLGLAAVLVALAGLLIWRLADLLSAKGRWVDEATSAISEYSAVEPGQKDSPPAAPNLLQPEAKA